MSKTVKHKTADTPPSRRMPNRDVRPFFEKLAATIDEPVTELNYNSNFELLIAVILSAQATDVSVNIATNKLYPVANTPESILALGEEGLKTYIKNTPFSTYFSKVLVYLVFKITVKTIRILNSIKIKNLR